MLPNSVTSVVEALNKLRLDLPVGSVQRISFRIDLVLTTILQCVSPCSTIEPSPSKQSQIDVTALLRWSEDGGP
jgi:hypothetical protein